ncbi:MAG TPA: 16S rRNA (cytosine(1402)-N(4))-methyltransferase RsmH [Candidatus Binatia bacterium]
MNPAGEERPRHEPVMLHEVTELLAPAVARPGARIVDVTLGLGGHSAALLERAAADARLLGLDRDDDALAIAGERLAPWGERVVLRHARFSELAQTLDELGWERVDAVVADLGVSSLQLDDAQRGFSFQREGELDMRMDRTRGESAADLLARLSQSEIAALLRDLGEEPEAKRIARALCRAEGGRPRTTQELRAAVLRAVGGRATRRHDPATLTFQALRIAVNDELGELENLLETLPQRLAPGARVAFLAYHSLEDRIVKQHLRRWSARCVCPPELPVCQCGGKARAIRLTPGAQRPSDDEVARNPRARSARLRAVEWVDGR